MNPRDASATPEAGGLLARMMVVAQLREHMGRRAPGRVLLDSILRQMLLLRRMLDRLGVAAPRTPLDHAILHEIEAGCLECTAWRRCRQWLDGRSPDDDYRDFCPNEGFLGTLPRQDAVKRPHAPE